MPQCTRSCLSCTLRLYMCNVIAAGMSKQATQTQFLGKYKIQNTPFLRSAHLPEAIVRRGPPLTFPAVTCRTFPMWT